MPCRYDPSPQEIEESQRKAKAKRQRELDKLDDLTEALCHARETVVKLAAGTLDPAEFKETEEYKRLFAEHVTHRKQDRKRAVEETTARLLKADKDPVEKNRLLGVLGAIILTETDDDLVHTELF